MPHILDREGSAWCALVLGVVTAGGCVSLKERPATWPADVPVTRIAQIEGTYAQGGRVFGRMAEPATVDDEINLRAEPGERLVFEFTLSDGTRQNVSRRYRLEDGWVIVGDSEGTNREGVLAVETASFALRTDATGALIVKQRSGGAGLVLLIPVAGVSRDWHRLEKGSDPTPPILTLVGADIEQLAAAWRTNFHENVLVSETAKAKGVRFDFTATTRADFRLKTVAAMRAHDIVITRDGRTTRFLTPPELKRR